jgi:hypothetical protein
MADDKVKILDRKNFPIVPNAEIATFAPDGTRRRKHSIVLSVEPSLKHRAVIRHRVLGTLKEGATTADRCEVVRKSDQYARDKLHVHGVPPSKGRVATPKKKVVY